MCGVEISDTVFLKTWHPGGGGFGSNFFVEGIHYEVSPMRADMHDVTLTLDVSPDSFFSSNPFGNFDDTE